MASQKPGQVGVCFCIPSSARQQNWIVPSNKRSKWACREVQLLCVRWQRTVQWRLSIWQLRLTYIGALISSQELLHQTRYTVTSGNVMAVTKQAVHTSLTILHRPSSPLFSFYHVNLFFLTPLIITVICLSSQKISCTTWHPRHR